MPVRARARGCHFFSPTRLSQTERNHNVPFGRSALRAVRVERAVLRRVSQHPGSTCKQHSHKDGCAFLHHPSELCRDPLSRAQREGPRPGNDNPRHGWAQVGRILAYEETFRVQAHEKQVGRRCVLHPSFRILLSFGIVSRIILPLNFFCYGSHLFGTPH